MTFQTHFPRLTLFLFSQGNQYAQQVTNQVLPDNCPATGHESYVLYLQRLKFTVYIMHIAMVTKLPNKAGLRVLSYLHIDICTASLDSDTICQHTSTQTVQVSSLSAIALRI